MNLTIVRHGQTLENANKIIMGQHGGQLSEKGIGQAKDTAEKLKGEHFDQACSSDLKRCVDTAKYILKFHPGLKLQTNEALREVNYGEYQGRPSAEIQPLFEQAADFLNMKVPGGESHREMFDRTVKFVNELYKQTPSDEILVVTHTGPIEAIKASVNKTPRDELFSLDAKNASIWHLQITEPLKLYPES